MAANGQTRKATDDHIWCLLPQVIKYIIEGKLGDNLDLQFPSCTQDCSLRSDSLKVFAFKLKC